MKLLFSLFFLAASSPFVFAQKYIDFQQNRIDLIDGIEDQQVANYENTEIFFKQIDELQAILNSSSLSDSVKKEIQLALYFSLIQFTANSSISSSEANAYELLEEYLHLLIGGKSSSFFQSKPKASYTILPYIYKTPEAHFFLSKEAQIRPDWVLKNYKYFANASYAQDLLSQVIAKDPISAKQYFSGLHVLYAHLKKSSNPIDQLVLKIYRQSGISSNALCLLQSIKAGDLTIEEAHEISKPANEAFFDELIQLSITPSVLAKHAIENMLQTICTNKIRVINSLFENHDDSQRFKSAAHYSPAQIYHLLVFSEEEIFTSSFNGMFNLLLDKTKKAQLNHYELLESVNFVEFRTFLKMCIAYGKLPIFLEGMTQAQREMLFDKFVFLDGEEDILKEAVSVADALGSIEDSLSLHLIEEDLLANYEMSSDPNTQLIYTLLMKLFEGKANTLKDKFVEISKGVEIPAINEINPTELFGSDKLHTQIHCFYDDEDGISSFQTFMNLWQNSKWKIKDYGEFVLISNIADKPIQILANKPQYDSEGQKLMRNFVDSLGADIEVLVHRGHSFYVSRSLNFLQDETKIVLLGSCGGYHQVSEILNQSPSAHIISTKQIGTYTVNNPLIYKLAQTIENQQSITWDQFWPELAIQFEPHSYAQEKFVEYVPPHQNLGAAFIKAYRSEISKD